MRVGRVSAFAMSIAESHIGCGHSADNSKHSFWTFHNLSQYSLGSLLSGKPVPVALIVNYHDCTRIDRPRNTIMQCQLFLEIFLRNIACSEWRFFLKVGVQRGFGNDG